MFYIISCAVCWLILVLFCDVRVKEYVGYWWSCVVECKEWKALSCTYLAIKVLYSSTVVNSSSLWQSMMPVLSALYCIRCWKLAHLQTQGKKGSMHSTWETYALFMAEPCVKHWGTEYNKVSRLEIPTPEAKVARLDRTRDKDGRLSHSKEDALW